MKYPHLIKKDKYLIDIEMKCDCDLAKNLRQIILDMQKKKEYAEPSKVRKWDDI